MNDPLTDHARGNCLADCPDCLRHPGPRPGTVKPGVKLNYLGPDGRPKTAQVRRVLFNEAVDAPVGYPVELLIVQTIPGRFVIRSRRRTADRPETTWRDAPDEASAARKLDASDALDARALRELDWWKFIAEEV